MKAGSRGMTSARRSSTYWLASMPPRSSSQLDQREPSTRPAALDRADETGSQPARNGELDQIRGGGLAVGPGDAEGQQDYGKYDPRVAHSILPHRSTVLVPPTYFRLEYAIFASFCAAAMFGLPPVTTAMITSRVPFPKW